MTEQKKLYSCRNVMYSDVVFAFEARMRKGAWAKASRVVSGLLKAAVRRNEIERRYIGGRVTGYTVVYEMTEQQLADIRAKAIARASKMAKING